MSGTFEDIHVPPTLVSFAVTTDKVENIISPEFKEAGHKVYLLEPELNEKGLPKGESLKSLYNKVTELMRSGIIKACYTPTLGGIAEAVLKMCMGNGIGFEFSDNLDKEDIFGYKYGSFVVETESEIDGLIIGETKDSCAISYGSEMLSLDELFGIYEDKLEPVYPCNIKADGQAPKNLSYNTDKVFSASVKSAKPKVLISAFPGTNCEYDTAKAFMRAGAEPEIFVINNLTSADVARSISEFAQKVRSSQMIFIPGGFSAIHKATLLRSISFAFLTCTILISSKF